MIEDMGEYGSSTPPPLPPGEHPVQPKSRSKARGVAAGVGVALVVAAGGGAIAASGSTPSGSPGAGGAPASEGAPPTGEGPAAGHFPGGGGRGPGGMGGFAGGFGGGLGGGLGRGVLHGTFVVDKTGGGYETEQIQSGTVGAVSATSLQVTSKDGFKATYVVPAGAVVGAQRDGISSVKKGDDVTVTATVSGSTFTVSRLLDTTDLKATAGKFAGGPGGGFGQGGPGHRMRKPGSSATPTAPPTTS